MLDFIWLNLDPRFMLGSFFSWYLVSLIDTSKLRRGGGYVNCVWQALLDAQGNLLGLHSLDSCLDGNEEPVFYRPVVEEISDQRFMKVCCWYLLF